MSLDFYKAECSSVLSYKRFGLCDDENGEKAYYDIENEDNWIALVKNDSEKRLILTAIDNCAIESDELKGIKKCDCMLRSEQELYLIELKNKQPPWQSEAIEQLRSTIALINNHFPIEQFKKRKAFACNKKRPRFVEIDNEDNLKFMLETGFRLDIQSEIIIV
jgi:hypothetical protein